MSHCLRDRLCARPAVVGCATAQGRVRNGDDPIQRNGRRLTAAAIDSTTLAAQADFPARLEAHFAAFPLEHRNWLPPSWQGVPSEPFTAIEQLCHVKDIEIDGYHVRLQRTLAESNPQLR